MNVITIGIILLVAILLVLGLRLVTGRVVKRLARIPVRRVGLGGTGNATVVIGPGSPRAGQRLETFRSMLNSVIVVVVGSVALAMILDQLGVAVAPLLASAGVVGVALAFGAQTLVRDILSGLFMLIEDQFGVGDRVELGALGNILAAGTVEQVALRVTTIRDDDGHLWHVRNGEILRVANESQGWAQAVATLQLSDASDLASAREAMESVTAGLRRTESLREAILSDAQIRVEEINGAGVLLRWSVRSKAGDQWRVASAMRRDVVVELASRGVTLA